MTKVEMSVGILAAQIVQLDEADSVVWAMHAPRTVGKMSAAESEGLMSVSRHIRRAKDMIFEGLSADNRAALGAEIARIREAGRNA